MKNFHSPFRLPVFHTLLTACLPPLLLSNFSHARNCYLPNGEIEKNNAPCFPQNPESACCGGSTYVCATNNMCAHYDGSYYVIGSCTDPTWNSPACPGYCYFRDHIHNSVVRCTDDSYCCLDGPECNCTTLANTQKILDFLPPYSELVGSSVSLNTDVATTTLVTPLGATPPSTTESTTLVPTNSVTLSASGTASSPRSELSSIVSSIEPTRTGEGGTGGPTIAPELPTAQTNDNDIGMKVGLGVGIPLAVIAVLLAMLIYHLWKRGVAASAAPGSVGSGGGGGGGGAAASSGVGGFFSRLRRHNMEDPTNHLPMLANTSPVEAPYMAMTQPANGHGLTPLMHGHYKPDDPPTARTPLVVHEAP